jgi:uncharacterized LabA/DUF88 family protein
VEAGRIDRPGLPDTRLKIAVFIDFDNIEIGVKSTLGGQFDIGVVLDALKERGEVVSKIAYGDWTRAGDYSRSLTQHATKLVQRNLTPGGDKNGADINLALDALETVFTHNHINAYVIVGGDSDFITLVEKLKQYDKQVFVVGGRSFTSVVMQRNCHEFIAYENLVGSRRGADRKQMGAPVTQAPIDQAVPLVRRALKVLSDREVSPQLGLLKSTLLQLDSTFSERTYGVSSFRDFAEKLASAGHVTLREHGRNVLVELAETNGEGAAEEVGARHERQERHDRQDRQDRHQRPERHDRDRHDRDRHDRPERQDRHERQPRAQEPDRVIYEPEPSLDQEPRAADGVREVRRIFQSAPNPPRWPMYIRQAKQFMRVVDPAFDERKFGFGNLVDLLRACQREGLLRMERDRQGVIRLFPGNIMQPVTEPVREGEGREPDVAVEPMETAAATAGTPAPAWTPPTAGPDTEAETEVVDAAVVQELDASSVTDGEQITQPAEAPKKKAARGRKRTTGEPRPARKAAGEGAAPRVRKGPPKPRAPRPRKQAAE